MKNLKAIFFSTASKIFNVEITKKKPPQNQQQQQKNPLKQALGRKN